MNTSAHPPFWHCDYHAARRPFLLARQRVMAEVRSWFMRQNFIEVETTQLQISPGNETHLHAFATQYQGHDGERQQYYLHTSPEFAMKKLLSAGEQKIFQLARVFRNGEMSALHAPEFIMLEWYRVGEDVTKIMADCVVLIQLCATACDTKTFQWRGRVCNPLAPAQFLSVREAFLRYAGVDLYDSLAPDGTPQRAVLAQQIVALQMRIADDDTWSDLFSRLLSEKVEPHLGQGHITVLTDYPACEAALARISPKDPRISERFELYACGVELANGFGELTDATIQCARFEADMAEQQRIYGFCYPLDEDFLAALAAMPQASGCAMGLERLIMLCVGAKSVAEVQWTPL